MMAMSDSATAPDEQLKTSRSARFEGWSRTTTARLQKPHAGHDLQCLVGNWVWILLPARVGLAVISSCYQFINENDDEMPHELWTGVKAELSILVALLDPLTRQRTTMYHGAGTTYDALKRYVLEQY